MTRQRRQSQAQDDLCRARWPSAFALDFFQSFQEAAEIDQQSREVGPGRIKRTLDPATGAHRHLGYLGAAPTATAPPGGHRRRPVGRDARHHLPSGIVGAQALAGGELDRIDVRPAIAVATVAEPGERALILVHGDRAHPAVFLPEEYCDTVLMLDGVGIVAGRERAAQKRHADAGKNQTAFVIRREKVSPAQPVDHGRRKALRAPAGTLEAPLPFAD